MPDPIENDPVAQEAAELFAMSEGYSPADTAEAGQDQGTGEDQGMGDAQPTGGTEDGPKVDWESEDNPYRQRYTGLQGTFKQVQTERQVMMQRQAELEERAAIAEAVANGASDEEVQAIRKNWQDQGQIAEFVGALGSEVSRIEQAKRALEPAAKEQGLTVIAEQRGIDRAVLAQAVKAAEKDMGGSLDPRGVFLLAVTLEKQGRTSALKQRREQGVDRAESGGGGRTDISKLSPLEKIRLGVAQESRR